MVLSLVPGLQDDHFLTLSLPRRGDGSVLLVLISGLPHCLPLASQLLKPLSSNTPGASVFGKTLTNPGGEDPVVLASE